METPRADAVRRAFVAGAGFVLGLALLVGIWVAIDSGGPAGRVKELMPVIDAWDLDAPLPDHLAQYPLEPPPGAAGGRDAVRLADYPRDTLIFLNLWATWCEPCVREIPSMIQLHRELGDERFRMLAVSYDESWSDLTAFFSQFPDGVPHELDLARDPAKVESQMLRVGFGTDKIPETYIIRNGVVLSRFINERNWMDPAIVEYFQRLLEM
jgi:thiol-disulfide isomerase/thioredoxin